MMKEVEVTTGLMMLTFKCVPSRGRYTVGWGKLLREPNHESVHPGAAVYLTRVAWTERNQKIHLSQGVQGHLDKQGHPSHQGTETEREREDESSLVDCSSWTLAAKANNSEWGREVEDKGKVNQG